MQDATVDTSDLIGDASAWSFLMIVRIAGGEPVRIFCCDQSMNLDTGVTYVTMSKSNGLPLHCRRCCDANLGDTTLRCPYGPAARPVGLPHRRVRRG